MTPSELLSGIRDADLHNGGIRCLRLFRLSAVTLGECRAEVERLCRLNSPSDVVRPGHATRWTGPFGKVLQYSLWNTSGRYDDFSSDHDLSCFGKHFDEAETYCRLASLIQALPHLVNFRINVLGPGSGLQAHEENVFFLAPDGSVGARLRFHLPLETNGEAHLTLDGYRYCLEQGVVHFVNHGCVHAAVNGGSEARVHLVWDMLLTREVFASLFDAQLAFPADPIGPADAAPTPIGMDPLATYRRLPPTVPVGATLELCRPQ